MTISAREIANDVLLRIIDDGVGFDVASAPQRGVASMKDRASGIGARLEIRSSPGNTVVEIVIPRELRG